MRVLIVTPEYPPDSGGGIGSYYAALVPALERRGCEVVVLQGSAFKQGNSRRGNATPNFNILDAARFTRWMNRFNHFAMFPMLSRHLAAAFALHEQGQELGVFDVVEATDWAFTFLPWVLEGRAHLLVQLHGSCGQISGQERSVASDAEGILSALIERTSLGLAPFLSSYSRANCEFWKALLERDVEYIEPPVRLEEMAIAPSEAECNWLTFGRIQDWKGPDIACEAWKLLGDDAPLLLWYGRDTMHRQSGESKSQHLAQQYPEIWGKQIQVKGTVPAAEARLLMGRAKAILVASTWDVFNLTASEGMLAGKPVVVSREAGASELIQDETNGFIFDSGDAASLAQTIRRIESLPPAKLCEIGAAGRITALERLSPDRIAEAKLELYAAIPAAGTKRTGEWLHRWLLTSHDRRSLDFLNSMPLRDLLEYVMRRATNKLGIK